jgi:tripartite-type tricarboxylate transporter receptor subunit TctC
MNVLKSTILSATAAVFLGLAPAQAADIPCDTAQLIVPWKAGGGTHVLFSIFEKTIQDLDVKPKIKVVTIPGQGGNKGAKEAVDARPDGCTLFAIHQSAITSYFTGRIDFTWDAFAPVALLTRTPPIYGANPNVPWNNVEELIADAKQRPGEILVGATLGSTSHFWFLLLEDKADVKFKYVSYDGTRERMTALLANNIQLGEINLAAAKKYIETGELKALGIATEERNPEIPDVPTLKEQGIDLVAGTDRGVVAPKGTPDELIQHWEGVFAEATKDPQVVESMTNKGTQIVFLPSDAYRKYFEDTYAEWERIAKKVGVYQREEG